MYCDWCGMSLFDQGEGEYRFEVFTMAAGLVFVCVEGCVKDATATTITLGHDIQPLGRGRLVSESSAAA